MPTGALAPDAASRRGPGGLPAVSAWPEILALALLLAGAAAIRVLRWQGTSLMFNDGPTFLTLAQWLSEGRYGEVIAHPYHPLYPFLVLLAHFWVGDWEQAAVLVSVIGGAASVLCLWLFVRASFGREAAWIAAIFLAVQPRAIAFSADILSDGLYLALFLAGVSCLWRAVEEEPRPALAGWAGVFSGLAYLARPEGLGIVVVGAALAALHTLRGRWRPVQAGAWLAALVAAALMVALPYLTLLRIQNGGWVLTQKKSVTRLLALDDEGQATLQPYARPQSEPAQSPAAEASKDAGRAGIAQSVAPSPGIAGAQFLRAAFAVVRAVADAVRPWFLGLILLGAWVRRGRPGPAGELILCFLGLYAAILFTQSYHYGYVGARHALPPMVLTFGYLAVAIPVLGSLLLMPFRRARGAPMPHWLEAGAGLALVAAIGLGQGLRPERPGARAEKNAALWLAANAEHPGAVAAPKMRLAYYAGRAHVSLYAAPRGAALIQALHQQGAQYVILEDRKLSDFPELGAAVGTSLRLVHSEENRGRRAFVYELTGAVSDAAAAPVEAPKATPREDD